MFWGMEILQFHNLGQTDDVCPSCEAPLSKRPQRKTKCPHCGQVIYSRKRPLDEQKVLLNEEEAAIIENDWVIDYWIKRYIPREPSPLWQERFDVARRTKTDPDPVVEKLARKAFDETMALIRQGMTPREARDKLLPPEAHDELSKKIEIRLWQLQVQSVSGTDF